MVFVECDENKGVGCEGRIGEEGRQKIAGPGARSGDRGIVTIGCCKEDS